jgi:hypothetical protein
MVKKWDGLERFRNDMCPLSNIIRVIKSSKVKCVKKVASTEYTAYAQ